MIKKLNINSLIPVIMFILFFLIFLILTKGQIATQYNLKIIVEQSIPVIIGGLGMIFVISQGSIDISQGAVLALAGTVSTILVTKYGIGWLYPSAILVGAACGLLSGVLVSVFKMLSIMVTLSLLIGIRGLVNHLIGSDVHFATAEMFALGDTLYLAGIILFIIMGYLFKYTKMGYYSKAIGENETAVKCVGIPVRRIKALAFMLSGIMAGIVGVYLTINIGGANNTMGLFFELRVMMAIFVGGVPVSGGMQSKLYKLLIGAPTIVLLENGLVLCGVGGEIYQAIQGVVLMLLVFLTLYLNKRADQKPQLSYQ